METQKETPPKMSLLQKKTSRKLKSLQQPKAPLQSRACIACPAAAQLQVLILEVVCERCISQVFCCSFQKTQIPLWSSGTSNQSTLVLSETTLALGQRGWSPPGELQGEFIFLRKMLTQSLSSFGPGDSCHS